MLGLFNKKEGMEKAEQPIAEGISQRSASAEIPLGKAAEIAVGMDPRLIYRERTSKKERQRTGQKEKIYFRHPCVPECADCLNQFKPKPYEGKEYCETYLEPADHFRAPVDGRPETGKVCPFSKLAKPKDDGKDSNFKLNPLKASKRGVSQVSAATGSRETGKKPEKKS